MRFVLVLAETDPNSAAYKLGQVFGVLLLIALFVGLPILLVVRSRRANERNRQQQPQQGYGYGAPEPYAQPQLYTQPYPYAQPQPGPSPLPPAGWHADPQGRSRLRYWDGEAWTEHTAD